MKKHLLLMLLLSLSTLCALGFISAAKAEYDYYQRVADFLDDPKFKPGTEWNNATQMPKTYSVQAWGCNAYVRDFVHECWESHNTNPYYGEGYFDDPAKITDGDIIFIEGYDENGNSHPHWYAVVQRLDGNRLRTIEASGNLVREQEDKYTVSNPGTYTLVTRSNGSTYNVYLSFVYGYHMPGYKPYTEYANLGDDFYAVILNTKHWKPISQKENTNRIYLETENGSSKQIWRFLRQEDESYVISSCYDGKLLEMSEGKREICTQITAAAQDWGGAYQRWYLIPYGNGYIIKSKHYPDENWVMDNHGGFDQNDNIIQINNRNNSSAQIWSIYKGDDVQLKGPTLTVTPGNSLSATRFVWTSSYGATTYNVRIFKDVVWEGEDFSLYNATSGAEVSLPAGNYVAYVDAINYHKYMAGAFVHFTVDEAAPLVDLYDSRDEALTLILPGSLIQIHSEAFENTAASCFILPPEVESIESKVFPGNSMVFLYGQSIRSISETPFNGSGILVEMGEEYNMMMANLFEDSDVQYLWRDGTPVLE